MYVGAVIAPLSLLVSALASPLVQSLGHNYLHYPHYHAPTPPHHAAHTRTRETSINVPHISDSGQRLCNEMLALAVATHGAGDLIAAIC